MASDQNNHSSPTQQLQTNTPSIMKCTEPDGPMSSTVILMNSNISPSPSSAQPTKETPLVDDYSKFRRASTRKQTVIKELPAGYLRHRLCMREFYFARLALVSNLMSFLGVLGIILMIIENELTFRRIDNQDTKASWFIKLIITISTAILLVLIFYYHHLDMTLYAYRNFLYSWRIELTTKKIFSIMIEVVICIIHPVPRSYPHTDPPRLDLNSSSSDPYSMSYTAIDVGLGLPMFFRLYLLGRTIMLHSHVIRNITLRSFGYLNNVSIDVIFLIKSDLKQWPTRCLFIFCTLVFFIGSWSLRACNYKPTREHLSMSDSMWLFVITFTTVGYGDLYPSTYCGRSVATIIALIGLLLSALLIAILSNKLLLTREQKYVHHFVLNARLSKRHQNQAANVIKFAMRAWFLKRKNKSSSITCLYIQRKLFRSIDDFQTIKQERRNLVDTCLGFPELMTTQRHTHAHAERTNEQILTIKSEIKEIRKELNNFNRNMDNLQKTLELLLNKTA